MKQIYQSSSQDKPIFSDVRAQNINSHVSFLERNLKTKKKLDLILQGEKENQ